MTNQIAAATEELLALLREEGYEIEEIGSVAEDGTIVNLSRGGEYVMTLTVTRTQGY